MNVLETKDALSKVTTLYSLKLREAPSVKSNKIHKVYIDLVSYK